MPDRTGKIDPKSDPRRHCLKLADWPKRDRRLGRRGRRRQSARRRRPGRGLARDDPQDGAGRLRPVPHLPRPERLARDAGPADRLTPDRLRAFIAELEEQVAPITLRNRVTNLAEALRVMVPEADFSWLRCARGRLKARAQPSRNKRQQIVGARDLFQLGLELMDRAEHDDVPRPIWRAALYRDGLMIMLLACRPIRRKSLAAMRIGEHLAKRGDEYQVALNESMTKSKRRYDRPLHPTLTQYIERYLDHYRLMLLGARADDHLWISWRNRPLSDADAYSRIVARTRDAFGIGVPPHRFRDSAMTSMGEEAPELVWLAPSLLHHADNRIAEKHYDLARDAQAVTTWQDGVRAQRRAARASARGRRKAGA